MSNLPQFPTADHTSIALEQSYLGSILVQPELYQTDQVSVEDFSTSLHRIVCRYLSESAVRNLDAVATGLRSTGQITDADVNIIASFVDGVLASTPEGLQRNAHALRELTAKRRVARVVANMGDAVRRGKLADLAPMLPELQRALETEHKDAGICKLADIPDVTALTLPQHEWLAPGIVARNHVTLVAGKGGCAKSLLAGLRLGHAIATGSEFLGRRCTQAPVLVLDYENAGRTVQDRLSDMGIYRAADLHIWGQWASVPPPLLGSQQLLDLAKKERPLIVVDPLRLAFTGDENDSGVMAEVLRHLVALKSTGSAVVVVHHIGRADGSTFRGSSVIRDLVDIHLLQEKTPEGQIVLKTDKARIGEPLTVTLDVDWDSYNFTVADDPVFAARRAEEDQIVALIRTIPGISQSQIVDRTGGKRERVFRLLREGAGRLWELKEGGRGRANLYFPTGSLPLGTGRELVEPVIHPVPVPQFPTLSRELVPVTQQAETNLCKPGNYPGRRLPSLPHFFGDHWHSVTPAERTTILGIIATAVGVESERLREHVCPVGIALGTLYCVASQSDVIDHVWPALRQQMTNCAVITPLAAMGIKSLTYRSMARA